MFGVGAEVASDFWVLLILQATTNIQVRVSIALILKLEEIAPSRAMVAGRLDLH